MKSLIGVLLATCLMMASMPVFADTQAQMLGAQTDLNKASPGAMQKHLLGKKLITQTVHVAKAKYDFAVQGGAVGAITLVGDDGKAVVLPSKAVVVDCIIDVITPATTSASGTLALSTGQSAADLKAALAAASYTGRVACIPVGTAASAIKLTADRTMVGAIATGALTAGKLYVLVQYVMSE